MKKNNFIVSFIKIGLSALFLISTFIYYFVYINGNLEKINSLKTKYNNMTEEKSFVEKKLTQLRKDVFERKRDKEAFVNLNKNYLTYEERNKFIVEFTNELKKISGVKINSIEYEKSDTDKKMVIKLNINGNYSEIRNFLFKIEKQFLFVKTEECSLNKDENKLRGTVIYSAWFGDDGN